MSLTVAHNSISDHDAAKARSEALLQKARDAAAAKNNYDSDKTRCDLRALFSERFGSGAEPYQWQLDVTEAILLGLDSVVIAGTGSGKTIPFMLPLLLHPEKMALVLSPLKILQRDQAQRFKKMKIPAVAVNGDTWSPSLSKKLDEHRHQAILTSPEMCLKHLPFRKWLTSKETADKIAVVIVDEAHCISQWGGDFRPSYAQLEKLRSFMPPDIPILLTSATLPPAALSECCARMKVELRDSFFLNLGNHRPNIANTVLHMDGSKDYKAIYDVLPDPNSVSAKEDFKKTIIFTNSVNATQILCRDVRQHYGPNFRRHIDFLHAHRTAKAKRHVMKLFKQGVIKLLIATEAAGMGADIPDIELVIQFGVPASLSIFSQRSGRAGRSANIRARAILLVEKSMFKRKKKPRKKKKLPVGGKRIKKSKESSSESDGGTSGSGSDSDTDSEMKGSGEHAVGKDDGKEWGKKVDKNLREYISTTGCRTIISDKYFNNPPRPSPRAYCDTCDYCLNMLDSNSRPTTPECCPNPSPSSSVHSSPSKTTNANGKRIMIKLSGPATRRGEHLKTVRAALLNWRYKTYNSHYSPSPFTSVVILPDPTITALASNGRIKSVADMQQVLKPPWVFASKHGPEVLELLEKLDKVEKEGREHEKLQRREQKKEDTAQRREAEKLQKKLKSATPKLLSPRRALVDSSQLNMPTYVAYTPHPSHSSATSGIMHSYFTPSAIHSPLHCSLGFVTPPAHISPIPFLSPFNPVHLQHHTSLSSPGPSHVSFPIPPSNFYSPFASQAPPSHHRM